MPFTDDKVIDALDVYKRQSFNNPFGACPECFGLGYKMEFDEDLMIPDKSLSIAEGAITVMGWQSCTDPSSFTYALLKALAKEYEFDQSFKSHVIDALAPLAFIRDLHLPAICTVNQHPPHLRGQLLIGCRQVKFIFLRQRL